MNRPELARLRVSGRSPRRLPAAAGVTLLLLGLGGPACEDSRVAVPATPSQRVEPRHVGAARCAGCHAEESARWRGSHHELAMAEARPATVLGDFSEATFVHGEERFRFYRRGEGFFVEAPDAHGEASEFEVLYTFGVEPLQQLLVATERGRLQALGVAWDARPQQAGGQRWFHLHPDEAVPPGDVLHWTGPAGSWNARCADCHSTNVSQRYDPDEDRYRPRWSEVNVACEACHGPGAAHVAWAEAGAAPEQDRGLDPELREERRWRFAEGAAIAHREPPSPGSVQLEVCAPCHARRSRIAAGSPGDRFLDLYRPALLEAGLYHPDGQILDEVYVWGSFVQSRMYAAGVVCSDCHDPHGLRIEAPDAVCATCHRSEVFAVPAHHHHGEGSAGASCVACHMPTRTYMVIDPRRDHGFKVPRPDLSITLGVPNACTGCHADRPPAWAAAVTARWFGDARTDRPHYAATLAAGRRGAPRAARALAELGLDAEQAPIVRATALSLLAARADAHALAALERGLRDPSALVRMAAAASLDPLPPGPRWAALSPLLDDPVRAVRIEAGRALAAISSRVADPEARAALGRAVDEYRAAQMLSADRAEARVNLGLLHDELGDPEAAEREYLAALRLAPHFVPAYVNLAELQRARGRDEEGERVLLEGLARVPESGALLHALGLLRVRQGRSAQALEALGAATRLEPDSARFAYVYAIALHDAGETPRALDVLAEAHRRHPGSADLLVGLATLHRDADDVASALRYARRLRELRPDDPAAASLVRELEARGR